MAENASIGLGKMFGADPQDFLAKINGGQLDPFANGIMNLLQKAGASAQQMLDFMNVDLDPLKQAGETLAANVSGAVQNVASSAQSTFRNIGFTKEGQAIMVAGA